MMQNSGRRRYMAAGAICLVLASAAPIRAQSLCVEVDRIVIALSEGEAGFEDVSLSLPDHAAMQADCRVSMDISGGRAVHCGWAFAYRAPEAQAAFDALLKGAQACVGADGTAEVDQPVNHPDAYALHQLRGLGRALGVSLKDKAGLQQSFVFLRIMPVE